MDRHRKTQQHYDLNQSEHSISTISTNKRSQIWSWLVCSAPDDEPGVEEEGEVGQLDQDDDALLVDELWRAEVGPGSSCSLRPEIAPVFANLAE